MGHSIIFILLFHELFLYHPKINRRFSSRELITDKDHLSSSLIQTFICFCISYSPP